MNLLPTFIFSGSAFFGSKSWVGSTHPFIKIVIMVILFLNKRIHNWDKVNIFQVKSPPQVSPLAHSSQLSPNPSGPQEVGNCWSQRPFLRPGGHSEDACSWSPLLLLRLPGTASVAPHALGHQAFTSIFSVPYKSPQIFTLKKFVFSLLTYRTYFICRIFRNVIQIIGIIFV